MKQLISKLKRVFKMLIWDFLMAAVLFVLLYIVVMGLDGLATRIAVSVVIGCFVLLMLILKYQMMYRQYGMDDVTGGNNKKEFERIARDLIHGDGSYVLVYANIDRFKLINEGYGNQIGDEILYQIQSTIDAEQLSALTDSNGNSYGITLYFGVYIIQNDDTDVSTMLEHANLARKKISPSHLVPMGIYNEDDSKRLGREKDLEMKMHKALENGDFVPYLQPKYELNKETIAGAEALVRWIDPEEGMIFPNEFIPLFEKNGFVVEIDLYMFEEACKLVEKWHKDGHPNIPVSVNLSRSHFEIPNFFDAYEHVLKRYDIPPKAIEIELTESLFYNNTESLNNLVRKIHKAGLSCSIDDFGSGYSSLNMLKEVRVDALKLDRVFFESTEDDTRGKDVIQSVIQLAQALDLHTISEGVEERKQVEFLKEMHCDLIQGYVFAKPMPVPEFEKLAFD